MRVVQQPAPVYAYLPPYLYDDFFLRLLPRRLSPYSICSLESSMTKHWCLSSPKACLYLLATTLIKISNFALDHWSFTNDHLPFRHRFADTIGCLLILNAVLTAATTVTFGIGSLRK